MSNEFKTQKLNELGQAKVSELSKRFTELVAIVSGMVSSSRERSLVITKMQEAFSFAVNGIGMQKAYQAEEE